MLRPPSDTRPKPTASADARPLAPPTPRAWTSALVSFALLGFSANSLLCRGALRPGHIDSASFTLVRIATGAATLGALVFARARRRAGKGPPSAASSGEPHATSVGRQSADPIAAIALFVYAGAFSFAYVRLDAGPGALLLFGSVQLTMIGVARLRGERLEPRALGGWLLATAGLVVLTVGGGVDRVDRFGAPTMILAGAAWGVYSLRGKQATDALRSTATNFAASVPLAVALAVLAALVSTAPVGTNPLHADALGLALASLSGAAASALAYTAWYAALPRLAAMTAAIVQLSVPVLTALLAIALLGETPSLRLAVASACVVGGVAWALRTKLATGERRNRAAASGARPR
jgi:drug/metabolite transporter (DMT)-like permease